MKKKTEWSDSTLKELKVQPHFYHLGDIIVIF